MADKIVSWGGFESKGTEGLGVTGSLSVTGGITGSLRAPSGSQVRIDNTSDGNYVRIQNRLIAFSRNNGTSDAASIDGNSDNQLTIYARSGLTLRGGGAGTNVMVINDEGGASGNASVLITGRDSATNSGSLHIQNSSNTQVFKTFNGGSVAVGTITAPTARFQVRGAGATNSTTALLIENSNASASLTVLDSGQVYFPFGDISYGAPSGAPIKLNITQPTGNAIYAGVNIGHLNTAVASNVTVVGGRNIFNNGAHIIFGHQNNISSASVAFIFGRSNTQTTFNGNHIMIGTDHVSDAYTNGQNASILIGQFNNTNGFYGGGLIGSSLKYYANRQLAFGGNSGNVNFALSQIYFGNGVRNEHASSESNNGHGPDISINTSQAYSGSLASNRNGGSISLRGGQGTGTGSAGDIIFATATTGSDGATYHSYSDRVWIKGHTGNVGIGTQIPTALLHISGASSAPLFEIDSPAVNNIIFVSGSGNVGFGTGTPGYPLDINGNNFRSLRTSTPNQVESGNDNYRIANLIGNGGYHPGLGTNNTYDIFSVGANPTSSGAGNTAGFFRVNLIGGNSTGYYGAAGSNNSLVQLNATTTSTIIASAQNNGIAMIGGTGAHAVLTTIAAGTNLNLRSDNNGSFAGGGINYLSSINGSNHSHRWYHNNSEQMRLSFGGNLLVGTTSELARVQVRGSGATSSTTALRVENSNASASLVVLDNGNVGAGTIAPAARLDVSSGSAIFRNDLNNSQFVQIAGIHSDGRQAMFDSSGNRILSWRPNSIAALGPSTGYITAGGLSGMIGWRISDTLPYIGGMYVGIDSQTGGTHKSLKIITGETGGTSGHVDLETISMVGNVNTGIRPHLRISADKFIVGSNTNTNGIPSIPTMTITGSNVGIGTPSPIFNLDVSGSGRFTSGLTVTGSLNISSGSITMPDRPAFSVYGAGTTSNLTTTQNGDGTLNSNNFATNFVQGSGFNSGSGIFTAPIAGLYHVTLVGRNSGYSAGISQLAVLKTNSLAGGDVLMIEWAASSTMNHTGGSQIFRLAAGDTLRLKVLAGEINFDGNDNWSVAYIG